MTSLGQMQAELKSKAVLGEHSCAYNQSPEHVLEIHKAFEIAAHCGESLEEENFDRRQESGSYKE